MNDLIRRSDAITAVGYYSLHSGDKLLFADAPLKALPSAQQWIPCSERFPEEDVPVLVTTIGKWGGFVSMDWVDPYTHKWNRSAKAIAWMPLPEPYRKDEEKGEAE